MFKKLNVLLMIFVILLLQVVPLMANTDNVVDQADLIGSDDEAKLQARIEEIMTTYGTEPVIVTTYDAEGKTSEAYADDYFDYNGYGVGDNNEGSLMLIDMDNRILTIITTGPTTINKYEEFIEDMYDVIAPNLTDGEYYTAANDYLDIVESIEKTGKMSNYAQNLVKMVTSPIPYFAALFIGVVATFGLTFSLKSKVTTTGRSYESGDSFRLSNQVDHFEHEHTSRRAIPKANKGGGGGGGRTGSSGTSHGGGGGRGF